MLDLFLDLLVVVLPTLLGILGAVMALRMPSSEHHWKWKLGFIAAGAAVSILTFWQQNHARASHKAEVDEVKMRLDHEERILNDSLLKSEHLTGQIESISLMLGKTVDRTGDPEIRTMARGVEKMLADSQSTKNLKAETLTVVRKLREIERQVDELPSLKDSERYSHRMQIQSEFLTLKHEASDLRISIVQNSRFESPPDPKNVIQLLSTGMGETLQEKERIQDIAAYLENLAKRLP